MSVDQEQPISPQSSPKSEQPLPQISEAQPVKLLFAPNLAPAHMDQFTTQTSFEFFYNKKMNWFDFIQKCTGSTEHISELVKDLTVSSGSLSHPKQQQYSIFEAEPAKWQQDSVFVQATPSDQSKGNKAPIISNGNENGVLWWIGFIEQLFQQVCGRRLIELRGLFYVINFVETKQCQACQYFHFANNQQNSRKRLQPFNRQITIFVFNIYQNILFVFQITLFIFYKCVCTLLCHFIRTYFCIYMIVFICFYYWSFNWAYYWLVTTFNFSFVVFFSFTSLNTGYQTTQFNYNFSKFYDNSLPSRLGLKVPTYSSPIDLIYSTTSIVPQQLSQNSVQLGYFGKSISLLITSRVFVSPQNKQTSLWSNEYIVLETQYFLQVGLRNQLLYNYYCSNELFQVVLWEYHENLQILTFNRVISQILILYISWLKFSTFCITINNQFYVSNISQWVFFDEIIASRIQRNQNNGLC
ncbi:Transmembrane_domain-containing protein [Hexamita inflata]|uniref:Transmembrane domain-containing protein n=1 Tax=Hexamita inflata TaxID=28002 RepID=A0AA86ULD7_9EUKA|nr:Transmembrane domain-containing protein [Hexamita inflata]